MNQTDYNRLIENIEDETANLITILAALQSSLNSLPNDLEAVYYIGRGIEAAKPLYRRIIRARRELQEERKDPFLSHFFELAEVPIDDS